MTNTIESLTTKLIDIRNDMIMLKSEEKKLLKQIADLAYKEAGEDTSGFVGKMDTVIAEVHAAEKKPSGKQPDPKSKRQRAFRLLQKNWSNKAIAKALNLREEHVSAYRRELKRGAKVAGV